MTNGRNSSETVQTRRPLGFAKNTGGWPKTTPFVVRVGPGAGRFKDCWLSSAKHDAEIVGRKIDNLDQSETSRASQRHNSFQIAQAPGWISSAQLSVESRVAWGGMAAEPAVRSIHEQDAILIEHALRTGEQGLCCRPGRNVNHIYAHNRVSVCDWPREAAHIKLDRRAHIAGLLLRDPRLDRLTKRSIRITGLPREFR